MKFAALFFLPVAAAFCGNFQAKFGGARITSSALDAVNTAAWIGRGSSRHLSADSSTSVARRATRPIWPAINRAAR